MPRNYRLTDDFSDYEHMFQSPQESDTVSRTALIQQLSSFSSGMQGEYWNGIRFAISIIKGDDKT